MFERCRLRVVCLICVLCAFATVKAKTFCSDEVQRKDSKRMRVMGADDASIRITWCVLTWLSGMGAIFTQMVIIGLLCLTPVTNETLKTQAMMNDLLNCLQDIHRRTLSLQVQAYLR